MKKKNKKPYNNGEDWLKDIAYLKWPGIIILLFIAFLLIIFSLGF